MRNNPENAKSIKQLLAEIYELRNRLTAREKQNPEAEHAMRIERLDTMRRLTRSLSHDLNNHLMPILGMSEFLKEFPENLDDKVQATAMLTDIHEAATATQQMTAKLQEFHRRDRIGDYSKMDINALIQDVAPKMEERISNDPEIANVVITIDADDIPEITVNAEDITKALDCLVLNAVEAVEHNSKVTIKTCSDGDKVVIAVSDNGPGMDSNTKYRCTDPFFSTKPQKGRGMGLPYVYAIAQRHRGTVKITSAPGEGTTITLYLSTKAPEDR